MSCSYLLVEADIERILTVAAENLPSIEEANDSAAPTTLSREESKLLLTKYRTHRGADHGTHLRAVLRMRAEVALAADTGLENPPALELAGIHDVAEGAEEFRVEPGFGAWALESCQACPRCLVIIRKETGCNHIQCRCGAGFCYGCGAPSDLSSMRSTWGSAGSEAAKGCLCKGNASPDLGRWLQAAGLLDVRNSTS